MIPLIDGLPESITGFKFTGKNYKQDYDDVVGPELRKLRKINNRIVIRVLDTEAKKFVKVFADFDYTDLKNLGICETIIRIDQPQ